MISLLDKYNSSIGEMLTHNDQSSVMKDVKETFLLFILLVTKQKSNLWNAFSWYDNKETWENNPSKRQLEKEQHQHQQQLIFSSNSKLDLLDDQIKIPFS
jgi:hypothetical protein